MGGEGVVVVGKLNIERKMQHSDAHPPPSTNKQVGNETHEVTNNIKSDIYNNKENSHKICPHPPPPPDAAEPKQPNQTKVKERMRSCSCERSTRKISTRSKEAWF